MKYELVLTYDDGMMKKEQSYLPELMCALAIYMQDDSWRYVQITNCQTGEVIAIWENNSKYGATAWDAMYN